MEKKNLKAVYDDDLRHLLQQLGLLEDFDAGRIECFFCHMTVCWESLHSLFPLSGAIKLVCSKPGCVDSLMRFLEENVNILKK